MLYYYFSVIAKMSAFEWSIYSLMNFYFINSMWINKWKNNLYLKGLFFTKNETKFYVVYYKNDFLIEYYLFERWI